MTINGATVQKIHNKIQKYICNSNLTDTNLYVSNPKTLTPNKLAKAFNIISSKYASSSLGLLHQIIQIANTNNMVDII